MICFINDYNNVDCLIYDIINNQLINYSTYLYGCLLKFSSLNIEYFSNLNEYVLYCFQSSSKMNLLKFDSNFDKIEDEQTGIYDLSESLSECTDYSLSSLMHDSDNVNIFVNCNGNILKKRAENPIPQTTISFTTIISYSSTITKLELSNNELVIIQKKSTQTKEEIINNLDNIMEGYDIGKIYEIFGNDYNIKISPINIKDHDDISTYIDFSNCEKILREVNKLDSSDTLTVYQMEINNPHEQSLINEVKYSVFNENKKRLNLSVCKDEYIIINYQINTSMINISKINYYSDLGIDIFNIEDNFFNDICYPYSEDESDIILKDRISDIYENFSVCENNCKYNNINLTEKTASCNCSIKTYVDSVVQPPRLDEIVRDSFTDSNLSVIKCYKLVFAFKNKIQNIGFWTFTVLVFLHFPLFIYYSIFNINSIKKFIFIEMGKFHYSKQVINPTKKINFIKRIQNRRRENNNKNIEQKSSNDKITEYKSSTIRMIKNKNRLVGGNSSISRNHINRFYEILNINERKNIKDKSKKVMKHKTIQPVLLFDYKVLNKNYINMNHETNKNIPKINQNKQKKIILSSKYYSLIQIDANNSTNNKPQNSDFLLDNYDYETAIRYDKRHFFRIFYICILAKESVINIIIFNTPLDLRALRICLFIFSNSCDLAFNTIFYSNDNISDKYHYEGDNLFLFTLINNCIISIISTIVSLLLVNVLQNMIDSRGDFEDIFRNEEKKMRKDKTYKVSKKRKFKILDKIREICLKLKRKITLFIIIEFLIMLFFYYFVTAFCEVYKKTQLSWLIDFLNSFLFSLISEISMALIITIFYILSIRYKLKFVYKVALFFYNL